MAASSRHCGGGGASAEAQLAQIMEKSHASREEAIAAVVKAQGNYAAIRGRELQRIKDAMFARACAAFDEGHKGDFTFLEKQGPDWGFRGAYRSRLRMILFADD